MVETKYIILCKASGEHFTFSSITELMEYLTPLEPEALTYHDELRIFKVSEELKAVPQEIVTEPRAKSWMLRGVKI